jgi:2-C-methyl-D-erythritol 4-phosphate cytidylyltransferase
VQTVVTRVAVIVAAGNGSRMGSFPYENTENLEPVDKHDTQGKWAKKKVSLLPKVLFPLGNTTVIERTVQTFKSLNFLSKIVVVINSNFRSEFERSLGGLSVTLVNGGETRADSVQCGLTTLEPFDNETLVAVHDGARCLCSSDLLARCFDAALKYRAVTAAIPVVDTLCYTRKVSSDEEKSIPEVEINVSRDSLWHIQTPQVFSLELLRKAYSQQNSTLMQTATDDASLVRAIHPVKVVEGERMNFKLTVPDDYKLALKILNT